MPTERDFLKGFQGIAKNLKAIKEHGEMEYYLRVVGKYEKKRVLISTAKVHEGKLPYETAIKHPLYDKREWIVVEAYATLKEASDGHNRWVKTMTTNPLPEELKECPNSVFSGSRVLPKKVKR